MRGVSSLNYHHLYYFWIVAKEESVMAAAKKLRLSQPTISAQLKSLEDSLGEQLFDRVGRRLFLSEQGKMVFRYANEIFTVGQELLQTLQGQHQSRPLRLHVGISDVVPKIIAHRLIQPALDEIENLEMHCHEGKPDKLLFELAQHNLDLVITDDRATSTFNTKLFDHLLGQSGVTFFAGRKLLTTYGKKFPQCLHEAPLLLPSKESALRKDVEAWLAAKGIQPRLVGEFDDSALMKVFGQYSNGFFYAPSILERDIERQYKVVKVGRVSQVKESFYGITAERKIVHPAVAVITAQGKGGLF